jgi:hypothetical protein
MTPENSFKQTKQKQKTKERKEMKKT